jgi:hypothetical protein
MLPHNFFGRPVSNEYKVHNLKPTVLLNGDAISTYKIAILLHEVTLMLSKLQTLN